MTLTLEGRAKAPRRVSEKSFEDAFAEALRECGMENWHITARDAGWPDRYVHTGIWIEFKVLERLSNDQLEPEQRARMRDLARAGEPVWYCALLVEDHSVILCRYPFSVPLAEVPRFSYATRADLVDAIQRQILGTRHAQ